MTWLSIDRGIRSWRDSRISRSALAGRPELLWMTFGLTAIVLYLGADSAVGHAIIYDGLTFVAAGVIILAITRHYLRPRLPWIMLAGGVALIALGDVAFDLDMAGGAVSEPAPADVMYLVGYILLCLAMARLLLCRGNSIASVLEAGVMGAAAGSVLWALVVAPQLADHELSLAQVGTVVAYPMLDIAMLSILLAALLAGRPFDRTTKLLAAAAAAFLFSDLTYTVVSASGEWTAGASDIGWMLGYTLWASAALSARHSDVGRHGTHGTRPIWKRLRPVALITACATPLLVKLYIGPSGIDQSAFSAAVASVAMSMLVIARFELLVRKQWRLLDDRQALESALRQQAAEDPLTELPNRRGLAEHLVARLGDERGGPALMILDLDDFKAVNDTLGHPAGDALLRVVAKRLRTAVRATDTVARLGGDEFAMILAPCLSPEDATSMAERLLRLVADPIVTEHGQSVVHASIGIAIADGPDATADSLLRDADVALYQAKGTGKDRWSLINDSSRAEALRSVSIVAELGDAVAGRELELFFQPVVSLATGAIDSFEALLRWNHPTHGSLLPGAFLPAAEHSAHMRAVDRWVLEEACGIAAGWRRLGVGDIGVRVNVSTVQLADEHYPDAVLAALGRSSLPSGLLTLELREQSLGAHSGSKARLTRLRRAGVRLSIDDFGVATSTLANVAEMPITELKIDRTLFAGLRGEMMVATAVHLGQTLGLHIVAEGIETKAELARVRSTGCDAAQGYWIGRPVSASEVAPLLLSWSAPEPQARPSPVRVLAPYGARPALRTAASRTP